jgi:hypothetical protein
MAKKNRTSSGYVWTFHTTFHIDIYIRSYKPYTYTYTYTYLHTRYSYSSPLILVT